MISSLQLRAARAMLMLTAKQIHDYTGIATITLSRIENSHSFNINSKATTIQKLQSFYEEHGVFFENDNTIFFELQEKTESLPKFQDILE